MDRAVMFGMSSSAGVFGCVADMLVGIYTKAGFGPLLKWVDDFFVIRLPHHTWTEEDFIGLTSSIGVPWSLEKLRPLSVVQRYIGFDWNLATQSVSLPQEKRTKIITLIKSWRQKDFKALAHDAASLHGKLVHVSCIYHIIRPFLRSISYFASNFRSPRAHLNPPHPVTQDLKWILDLLEIIPSELSLWQEEPIDLDWWGDASTGFGIGVTIGKFWAVWKWRKGICIGPKQRYDIGWAEAVAVELALVLALYEKLLVPGYYLVRSDNSGVVSVLNKGRSKSKETNEVLKRIYTLLAENSIRLKAVHVSSRSNITDSLSRGKVTEFLKGFPQAQRRSDTRLPSQLQNLLEPFSTRQ